MGRIVIVRQGGRYTILDGKTPIGTLPDGQYTLKAVEPGEELRLRERPSWRYLGIGAIAAAAFALIARFPAPTLIGTGAIRTSSMGSGESTEQRLWRVCRIDATSLSPKEMERAEKECRSGRWTSSP